ncbi:hypothetical protein DSECCO2_603770 [anaerobic digester metagenome]
MESSTAEKKVARGSIAARRMNMALRGISTPAISTPDWLSMYFNETLILNRFTIRFTIPNTRMVKYFPITISMRPTPDTIRVSRVLRSFSPATRSAAATDAPESSMMIIIYGRTIPSNIPILRCEVAVSTWRRSSNFISSGSTPDNFS